MNPDNHPTIRVEGPVNVTHLGDEGLIDINPAATTYLLPDGMNMVDICQHLEQLGAKRIDNTQRPGGQPIYPDGTPSP